MQQTQTSRVFATSRSAAIISASLCILACAPAAPGDAGSAAPPAAGPGGAPAAPVTGPTGTATLTRGGETIALAADWVLTTHGFMSVQNKTAPEKGPGFLKMMFDIDPAVTKLSPALYVLPGWKAEEIVTTVVTANFEGKAHSDYGLNTNRPVLTDTTARVKGTYSFKMKEDNDPAHTVREYVLTFDVPYPATP